VLPRNQDIGTTQRKPLYEGVLQRSVGIVRLYVWIRRGTYAARAQALALAIRRRVGNLNARYALHDFTNETGI
jgi:hypothetical protein